LGGDEGWKEGGEEKRGGGGKLHLDGKGQKELLVGEMREWRWKKDIKRRCTDSMVGDVGG
jgi:hypothetical protein